MKEVIEKIRKRLGEITVEIYSNILKENVEVVNFERTMEIIGQELEEYLPDTNAGKKAGWIPVEERLPEDKQQVLVTNWDYSVFPARYEENSGISKNRTP